MLDYDESPGASARPASNPPSHTPHNNPPPTPRTRRAKPPEVPSLFKRNYARTARDTKVNFLLEGCEPPSEQPWVLAVPRVQIYLSIYLSIYISISLYIYIYIHTYIYIFLLLNVFIYFTAGRTSRPPEWIASTTNTSAVRIERPPITTDSHLHV